MEFFSAKECREKSISRCENNDAVWKYVNDRILHSLIEGQLWFCQQLAFISGILIYDDIWEIALIIADWGWAICYWKWKIKLQNHYFNSIKAVSLNYFYSIEVVEHIVAPVNQRIIVFKSQAQNKSAVN